MLEKLMGLTGLFSQAVGVGCCSGSLGDMGLVGRACVPARGMEAIGVLGGLGRYRGIVFSRGEIEARLFRWGPGPGVEGEVFAKNLHRLATGI